MNSHFVKLRSNSIDRKNESRRGLGDARAQQGSKEVTQFYLLIMMTMIVFDDDNDNIDEDDDNNHPNNLQVLSVIRKRGTSTVARHQ